MEIIIILIVILVVFYFCYLSSKNNKLTKTEAFDGQTISGPASQVFSAVAVSNFSSDPTSNHDYVTMYEDINFGGSTLNLGVGETSFETLNN
jgi:capsule polysaccharide export protein KpsE/RkpR